MSRMRDPVYRGSAEALETIWALDCLAHVSQWRLFERAGTGAKTRKGWEIYPRLEACDGGLRSLVEQQKKRTTAETYYQIDAGTRVLSRMLQVELAVAAGEGRLCGTPSSK